MDQYKKFILLGLILILYSLKINLLKLDMSAFKENGVIPDVIDEPPQDVLQVSKLEFLNKIIINIELVFFLIK